MSGPGEVDQPQPIWEYLVEEAELSDCTEDTFFSHPAFKIAKHIYDIVGGCNHKYVPGVHIKLPWSHCRSLSSEHGQCVENFVLTRLLGRHSSTGLTKISIMLN